MDNLPSAFPLGTKEGSGNLCVWGSAYNSPMGISQIKSHSKLHGMTFS